jgi:hypothetical protein
MYICNLLITSPGNLIADVFVCSHYFDVWLDCVSSIRFIFLSHFFTDF